MNLTKILREEFVLAVMTGLPRPHRYEVGAARAVFEARCYATVPDDIKRLEKKYPGATTKKKVEIPNMPQPPEERNKQGFRVYNSRDWNGIVGTFATYEGIDMSDQRELMRLSDIEEFETRPAIKLQIEAVAHHCTTVEELQKALPELIEYMPDPKTRTKKFAVAPTGLVKQMRDLGMKLATPAIPA